MATGVATMALAVALAVGVGIATPGLTLALFAPHDSAEPISVAARPRIASTPMRSTVASPAASYSGPLVGARGSMLITRAQLHTWLMTRSPNDDNTRIFEAETWLEIQCMARKGFLDDPTNPNLRGRVLDSADGLTTKQLAAYNVALEGPPTDATYNWRTAGCVGRSVHIMGQDHAN